MRISLAVVEKYNGVILYRGPSMLNGKPIVVVATGLRDVSKNVKTGKFIQTYILSDEGERPTDALNSGLDESVCGDCIHRKKDGWGTCYVNHGQGPNRVYRAVLAGSYPEFSTNMLDSDFSGRVIRLGSYGDPCALPIKVWDRILVVTDGWTGYTHQWRHPSFQNYKKYCMASVESEKDLKLAREMGWRTYRIRSSIDDPLMPLEFVCPASSEAGYRLSCENCMACSGGNAEKASVTIVSHGTHYKVKRLAMKLNRLKGKKRKLIPLR